MQDFMLTRVLDLEITVLTVTTDLLKRVVDVAIIWYDVHCAVGYVSAVRYAIYPTIIVSVCCLDVALGNEVFFYAL